MSDAFPSLMSSGDSDFASIARRVLSYLHSRIGFNLRMVTRTVDDDWIVLAAEDHGYDVSAPALFRWSDSFCSHMVEGRGPRVAPSAAAVPACAAAPIGRQVPIGAYIGVPLTHIDGTLFGTLCAIDPQPKPTAIEAELPLVEMFALTLSGLIAAEVEATRLTRRADRAQAEASTDALTGLHNRRGWDGVVEIEEDRCRRYGNPACVVAVDLDNLKTVNDTAGHAAGDELIRNAADALREAVRTTDVVARVCGDEFYVLGVECGVAEAEALLDRIRTTLGAARISASTGIAMRSPVGSLNDAILRADERMYSDKQSRKGRVAAAAG